MFRNTMLFLQFWLCSCYHLLLVLLCVCVKCKEMVQGSLYNDFLTIVKVILCVGTAVDAWIWL